MYHISMILQAFSKYLQEYAANLPSYIILTRWLTEKLKKNPETTIDKIIHAELTLIQDENGLDAVVGTTKSGQKLLQNLLSYTESYDRQKFSRWLKQQDPSDFNF